jgi:hypothetical protein
MMSFCNARREVFIEETEEAYHALLNCYPDRMPRGNHPEFDIRYFYHEMARYSEELMVTRGQEIENALHQWLQEEHRVGRLFEQERWRGFFEPIHYYEVEVCYQRLFMYDGYYFQVILAREIWSPPVNNIHPIYFELNLYGWINSERNTIQEYYEVDVDEDHMMPEIHWRHGKTRAHYKAYDAYQAELKRRKRWHWKTHKNRKRVYLDVTIDETLQT